MDLASNNSITRFLAHILLNTSTCPELFISILQFNSNHGCSQICKVFCRIRWRLLKLIKQDPESFQVSIKTLVRNITNLWPYFNCACSGILLYNNLVTLHNDLEYKLQRCINQKFVCNGLTKMDNQILQPCTRPNFAMSLGKVRFRSNRHFYLIFIGDSNFKNVNTHNKLKLFKSGAKLNFLLEQLTAIDQQRCVYSSF